MITLTNISKVFQTNEIDSNDILSQQEKTIKSFGDNKLSYGIPVILLVLLLIPAINIVVISIANINNRATENSY